MRLGWLLCLMTEHKFAPSDGTVIGLLRRLRSRCRRCGANYMSVFSR